MQGRVSLSVEELPVASGTDSGAPHEIREGGLEHDCKIRSPNTALAVRGTQVSLYDQPPFTPEAVSLSGRALFRNVRRELVPFGGYSGTTRVRGPQSSAACADDDRLIVVNRDGR
jgi:hypothetical protein